jgi:peptidoglycan glycosyltransferase
MNLLLFLLQISWKPETWFGGQVLERTPAGLTLIYLIGGVVLLVFLFLSFLRNVRLKYAFEENLPKEVKRKLSSTVTNRSLRMWQFVFIALAIAVYSFHVYWTHFADTNNEQFQALSYKDLRYRRTSASRLRGWMLDRTGNLGSALASYKVGKDGKIDRTFSLEKEMAHLLGTERGTPGLERTLYKADADPMPEAWEILTKIKKPEDEQRDVRITIDRDLQAFAAQQLQGKKGAVVVLNPQTGDVLAIYSNPSFSLNEAETLEGYLKLEGDKMNKPLLSRATREYYVPGSTFKTLTMMSAFRAGQENLMFPDLAAPDCYTPYKNSRAICDSGGSCEICSYDVPIREAYKVSSNQYFAQLANALGRERMRETAQLLGIAAVDTPDDALSQGYFPDIWNASNKRIANSISPTRSTMVTGSKITLYDFGLEGMGQGLAGQMTPFQMALVAAAAGNLEGKLMKPRIEADVPPQMFAQVLTAEQGAEIRDIMSTVTEEAGGTGGIVRSKLSGTGISTGGKTGTAEKQALVYDQKTGLVKTVTKKRKNDKGEWVEYEESVTYERTDGWFICLAPLENPQVAIAVVVEDIGSKFGGQTAAPIAADMILKARELGLLGEEYRPKQKTQTTTTKKRK